MPLLDDRGIHYSLWQTQMRAFFGRCYSNAHRWRRHAADGIPRWRMEPMGYSKNLERIGSFVALLGRCRFLNCL